MRIDEFILARVAEDEATARAAAGGLSPERWSANEDGGTLVVRTSIGSMGWCFGGGSGVWQCDDPYDDCGEYQFLAERESSHITRHDPSRVLAECEAKRRIIDAAWCDHEFIEMDRGYGLDRSEMAERNDYPSIIRILAAVYADHPDFDPEWRL